MRTEKEIREYFETIEDTMEIFIKLGLYDQTFVAFHVALEWVLQDPESQFTSDTRIKEDT